MAAKVEIYDSEYCPYCVMARRLLDSKGIEYVRHSVDNDESLWSEMSTRSNRFTVPQIFIDEVGIGGYDDMAALEREGKLDALLKLAP